MPQPDVINVKFQLADNKTLVVPVPTSACYTKVTRAGRPYSKVLDEEEQAKKISIIRHPLDLGFAYTDFKIQGLTIDRLVVMLNKEQSARIDLATLYVAFSRVKRSDHLRL